MSEQSLEIMPKITNYKIFANRKGFLLFVDNEQNKEHRINAGDEIKMTVKGHTLIFKLEEFYG